MSTNKTRSYNGCWTCRRRRRKCDGGRPNCGVCRERNLPCEGYEVRLRWGTGIASRGRFTGAEKPTDDNVLPRPPGRRRKPGMVEPNTFLSNSQQVSLYKTSPARQPTPSPDSPSSNVASAVDPIVIACENRAVSPEEQTLFQEFVDSGSRSLFAAQKKAINLVDSLHTLCEESRACYKICVALQAALTCDSNAQFFEYFDCALRNLRNELASSEARLKNGTSLACCLLCSICLIKGMPWTCHIKSLWGVIEGFHCISSLKSNGPMTCSLLEIMGILEMPCCILGRQSSSIHIWYRYCRSKSSTDDERDSIEPISGIPRSLLDLLSGIDFDTTEKDFLDWPGELGSFDEIQLWESYRCAGVLSSRRKNAKAPGRDDKTAATSFITNTPRGDVLVNRLLTGIEAIVRRKADMSKDELLIINALQYPLFIAGCELEIMHHNPEWKAFIERVFVDELVSDRYLQNIKLLALLKELWKGKSEGLEFDANQLATQQGLELGFL